MNALSLERALMAVEKVRERLLRTAAALDGAGVPYAVIGGHAVAVHVARIDEDAVRNTRDVDVLLNRADWTRAAAAMTEAGFDAVEVQGIPMFLERDDPSPKRGVHVIFAGEPVRAADATPAPALDHVERSEDGLAVIRLRDLLVMKLQANRLTDQVHVQDMLELGLVTREMESSLAAELRERLERIRAIGSQKI